MISGKILRDAIISGANNIKFRNRFLIELQNFRFHKGSCVCENRHHAVHLSCISLIFLISHVLMVFLTCIYIQAGKYTTDFVQIRKDTVQCFCTFFHGSLSGTECLNFFLDFPLCFFKCRIAGKQAGKIPAVRRIHLFSFFQFNFCHNSYLRSFIIFVGHLIPSCAVSIQLSTSSSNVCVSRSVTN